MDTSPLTKLARAHGSIVRSDLVPDHLSRAAWGRLHARGVLRRVHHGVSVLATRPVTPLLQIEAAVLAAGVAARADGPTSAWLWGATSVSPSDPIHVLLDVRGPSPLLPGVAVHRPTDLVDVTVTKRQRIACTNPLHALLGVAAWMPDATPAVLEELVVAGLFGIKAARSLVLRHARRGVPGITALRAACDGWTLGDRPPDSLLELRLGGILAGSSLPAAEFQHVIGPYRVDYAWPPYLAVLECDGWETHGKDRVGFERDRERNAWLSTKGWVVWSYTWRQIVERPGWVLKTLTERLTVRAGQLGAPFA